MTEPTMEWYREQSEYNRRFYERLQAAWPDDLHDWKVAALFYSALHRVNYHFVRLTGRAPGSHFERNQRVKKEMPEVFKTYRNLYLMSLQARYRDGLRTRDYHRGRALALLTSWRGRFRLRRMEGIRASPATAATAESDGNTGSVLH